MQIHILSDDTVLWQAVKTAQAQQSQARAEGLHLSTITNDIAATVFPRDFGYLGQAIDDATQARFEIGHVIEAVMARMMGERLGWERPRPRQCDGIWCSPDGWSARTKTIDEMKVTWKSVRDFTASSKWQVYLWQVLSYMHVWGAVRARIHVLHANGDYRPPMPLPPTTYMIRPTPAEIAENWRMVTTHAKDRGWLPNRRG